MVCFFFSCISIAPISLCSCLICEPIVIKLAFVLFAVVRSPLSRVPSGFSSYAPHLSLLLSSRVFIVATSLYSAGPN